MVGLRCYVSAFFLSKLFFAGVVFGDCVFPRVELVTNQLIQSKLRLGKCSGQRRKGLWATLSAPQSCCRKPTPHQLIRAAQNNQSNHQSIGNIVYTKICKNRKESSVYDKQSSWSRLGKYSMALNDFWMGPPRSMLVSHNMNHSQRMLPCIQFESGLNIHVFEGLLDDLYRSGRSVDPGWDAQGPC